MPSGWGKAGLIGIAVAAVASIPIARFVSNDQAPASKKPSSSFPTPGSRAGSHMPLVAIVHPTRGPIELTSRTFADLAGGKLADWSGLGMKAGRIRVALGPSVSGASRWLARYNVVPNEAEVMASDDAAVSAVERAPGVVGIVAASAAGPGVRTAHLDGKDPLRDPANYPVLVPGEPAGPVVTAMTLGDLIPTRTVDTIMAAKHDYLWPFRPTAARTASADFTFGNMDSPMSAILKPRHHGTVFVTSNKVLPGFRLEGLDVITLANNHSGNVGTPTMLETKRLLEGAGIKTAGAGANLAEALRPAIIVRHGIRFGIMSFDSIVGGIQAHDTSPGVAMIRIKPWYPFNAGDLAVFAAAVRAARSEVDVLIVYPHWGKEYTNVPNPEMRRVAHMLLDAGADMVIGTHGHWAGGMELYKGKLAAYELGNFVFDQTWSQETQEGIALELVFWGPHLMAADVVPVRIYDWGQPRFVTWDAGAGVLHRLWDGSFPPFRWLAPIEDKRGSRLP